MSTFVIRFLHDLPDDYRGRVRHVRSGDEKNFGSEEELLSFMAKLRAQEDAGRLAEEERVVPSEIE